MVDTPKEGNGNETAEDDPSKKQPKRQRQRHRSKSRHSENSDTGTRENRTLDDTEDNKDPSKPSFEQAEREDGQAS